MGIIETIKASISVFFRNFKDIFITFIIIAIIEWILALVLSQVFGGVDMALDNYKDYLTGIKSTNKNSINYQLITVFISNLVKGANSLAILDLIRGGSYGLSEVFSKLKDHTKSIMGIAGILTLIDVFLNMVPLIGVILSFVAFAAFAYVFYLIEDYDGLGIVDNFKASYELTKGYKFNIFLLQILYGILPFLLVLVFILFLIPLAISGLWELGFIFFLLITILSTFTNFLLVIGITLYYESNTQ